MLAALAQAADEGPEVRRLFNELTDGIGTQMRVLFERLIISQEVHVELLHALVVGPSVVDWRPAGATASRAPARQWKPFCRV